MSKPSPRHAAPVAARRGLAGAGALSLALAGGAFALASSQGASAATKTVNYSCSVTDLGITFQQPWTVSMTTDLPASVEPGATVPAPSITANVTTGDDATAQMRALNIKSVEGRSTANYSVGETKGKAELTVAKTTVPASGNLTTVAKGSGESFTAPTTAGSLDVKAADFTATLTTETGFVLNIGCTPAAGADTTIGTIQVGNAPTTEPTTPTTDPTTPTTDPTTPTTEPTTPTTDPTTPTTDPTTPTTDPTTPTSEPTTPTSEPTDSSTTSPMPSSSPSTTMGPKVETDYADMSQPTNLAGFAFAAGIAALGGAVVVGRRRG
jgi:hypothetical protein